METLPFRQIHLDFHTPSLPFDLAGDFDKTQFQERLLKSKVNSITLTGRCHHGFIYYDTELEARHPQMNGDFLMEQVDACHEIGIRAPIYLTVGWDAYMAERHPEWLERRPDGRLYGFGEFGQLAPGWKTLCFNTKYVDYLMEQIRDTINHFGDKLDGLFFDIMWQDPCTCNSCLDKMRDLLYDPFDEDDKRKFALVTENKIKETIYQVVRQMKEECPVFFNEGNITPNIRETLDYYGHLEIESLPSGEWGYQHFPTVVRYAKNLGKEYVGMTGKFHKVWSDFGSYKNQAALEYECFLALAHGAKCSIGDQMYPNGVLHETTYELIERVYAQVSEKEKYAQNVQAVTEIAILHPGIVRTTEAKVDISLAGAVNILNEAQYQFDIIDDQMEFSPYALIVLPDKIILPPTIEQKLFNYVSDGGKVLATYESGLLESKNQFPDYFSLECIGELNYNPTYGYFPELLKGELVLHGQGMKVEAIHSSVFGEEARPLFQRNYQHYYSHFHGPVFEKTGHPVGMTNERISYFSHPLFRMYKEQGVKYYKDLILIEIEKLLGGKKFVQGDFPSSADVVLNYQEKKLRLILNVLHYIPERRSLQIDTIEEAIPLHQISVMLNWKSICYRLGLTPFKKVKRIGNASMGQGFEWHEDEDGNINFIIPSVEGFEQVIIDFC